MTFLDQIPTPLIMLTNLQIMKWEFDTESILNRSWINPDLILIQFNSIELNSTLLDQIPI